jgi:hypothetical protein
MKKSKCARFVQHEHLQKLVPIRDFVPVIAVPHSLCDIGSKRCTWFLQKTIFSEACFSYFESDLACQILTFIALVEYAVVNVKIRTEAQAKIEAKKQKLELEEFNNKMEDESEKVDELTQWLMGRQIFFFQNKHCFIDIVGLKSESEKPVIIMVRESSNAEILDEKFRKIYPAFFGMFNIIYWGYFMN